MTRFLSTNLSPKIHPTSSSRNKFNKTSASTNNTDSSKNSTSSNWTRSSKKQIRFSMNVALSVKGLPSLSSCFFWKRKSSGNLKKVTKRSLSEIRPKRKKKKQSSRCMKKNYTSLKHNTLKPNKSILKKFKNSKLNFHQPNSKTNASKNSYQTFRHNFSGKINHKVSKSVPSNSLSHSKLPYYKKSPL